MDIRIRIQAPVSVEDLKSIIKELKEVDSQADISVDVQITHKVSE